jgi:hypothetical protein
MLGRGAKTVRRDAIDSRLERVMPERIDPLVCQLRLTETSQGQPPSDPETS